MGDAESGLVQLSFNSQLRVEFRGATVTSDAGLLLPRELDERLGLTALIERHLTDPRTGRNRQFPLADLCYVGWPCRWPCRKIAGPHVGEPVGQSRCGRSFAVGRRGDAAE